MISFLDTSALVKRYVAEPGSDLVRSLFRRKPVTVARIAFAELAATVARLWRAHALNVEERDTIMARLDRDFASMSVVEVRAALVDRIPVLVVRWPLRGYDAVQLAAALTVRERGAAVEFWGTDTQLLAAARGEGLRVVHPGR